MYFPLWVHKLDLFTNRGENSQQREINKRKREKKKNEKKEKKEKKKEEEWKKRKMENNSIKILVFLLIPLFCFQFYSFFSFFLLLWVFASWLNLWYMDNCYVCLIKWRYPLSKSDEVAIMDLIHGVH